MSKFEYLKPWQMPNNYFGATWEGYYCFLGQNRDSDALTRSNFRCGLKALGGESDTVKVIREGHWACGWIEWIAIHESNAEALAKADEMLGEIEAYPALNEDDWSALEDEEAQEFWTNCFSDQERLKYVRDHRSQFDFRDFGDLIGCVRGKYFAGYASELLY